MRLSIRTQLGVVAAIVLSAMSVLGWRGIVGMSDINEDLNAVKTNDFVPTRMIANTWYTE